MSEIKTIEQIINEVHRDYPGLLYASKTAEIEAIFKKWASHKDSCEVRYEANGDCDCGWYEDLKKISQFKQVPSEKRVTDEEILQEAKKWNPEGNEIVYFEFGAKWMRDKMSTNNI